MKPIWYFVGLILLAVGSIIFVTGIYLYFTHAEIKSVLGNLHPNVWWGGLMIIIGLVYAIKNKGVIID